MMGLPVLSLSSLASRVVFSQDLDTRDLPLHLHREMEQYRRLQGDFTLLSIDFEVKRLDGGEVSKGERGEAVIRFLECAESDDIVSFDVLVVAKLGDNKWSINDVGPGSRSLHMQDPVQVLQKNGKTSTKEYNVYKANYLENGKVISVEKTELVELNKGQVEVVIVNTSSFSVDPSGLLMWVHKSKDPLRGLVSTFTTRGARTQGDGHLGPLGDGEFTAC